MNKGKKLIFFGYAFTLTEEAKYDNKGKYRAKSVDASGKEYTLVWHVIKNHSSAGNDDMPACDWDNPMEVYPTNS